MVAAISGQGLGPYNTSATNLNGQGTDGTAAQGRTGEQIYVNTANGNLVLQDEDELLSAEGLNVSIVRTYNSQGQFDNGLGESLQRLGINESSPASTGTVNTAGSLHHQDLWRWRPGHLQLRFRPGCVHQPRRARVPTTH